MGRNSAVRIGLAGGQVVDKAFQYMLVSSREERAMIASLLVNYICTAQTVDLADFGASKDGEDHPIPQNGVAGKVIGFDKDTFACVVANNGTAGSSHLLIHDSTSLNTSAGYFVRYLGCVKLRSNFYA